MAVDEKRFTSKSKNLFSQTQEYKVNYTTCVQYEKIQKVYTSLPFTL